MKNTKLISLLLSLLTLASCTQDSTTSSSIIADKAAIVATVAADYSSGAHTVISKDANGDRIATNNLVPTGSDITVAANGTDFYRIERAFAGNNITKFSASDAQTPIWQYSTNDVGSAVLSNPYDMIFVSETKAYVLRNGSSIAWIVNPSATTEAEFKIGELDLSAYADADGVPEMSAGVIVNGKLYITLQRLDNFAVTQLAYVAIFDVNTDLEIDANIPGDTLMGIPLQTRNPGNIIYEPVSNSIFVQGTGSFWPEEFTGGIERIDLANYTTTLTVDDGDAITHPYGLITELAVVSDSVLYFVGYAGYADNTLYKLNLNTAEITPTGVVSLVNGQISSLSVDSQGLLWVSDSANATVRVIDPATDAEVDALYTNLNPEKVVFVK
ncbi:MAG: hypothetical protein OEY66_09985 [Gammaproteobacteria bacterium]|nr:hypothetical protein [Gammaproteobacteria bacterium]